MTSRSETQKAGQSPACVIRRSPSSVRNRRKREGARIAAEIGRRHQRLAVDRPVQVLAAERGIAVFRRERVVCELAVARQHFGAAVQPRALRNEDTGMRALLIRNVRAAAAADIVAYCRRLVAASADVMARPVAAITASIPSRLMAENVVITSSSSRQKSGGRSPIGSVTRHIICVGCGVTRSMSPHPAR